MDLESSLTSRPIEHDHYQNIRSQIEEQFLSMEKMLRETKNRLIAKLDSTVRVIRDKTQNYQQQFALLHAYKVHTEEFLRNNNFKNFKTHQIGEIDDQIGDVQQRYDHKIANIQLKWAENSLKQAINEYCKIVVVRSQSITPEYPRNEVPKTCFGSKGTQEGNLKAPTGIAIDPKTNNIYIADNTGSCVKVYSKEGKFLLKIDHKDKMLAPYGLCIDDDLMYVTQTKSSSISLFRLDGTFLRKIGKSGSNEAEFLLPLGVTTDPDNGDVYVCDSGNNRIQVFNRNLVFKRTFGNGHLKRPRDININANGEIIVLDSSLVCLHTFGKGGKHFDQVVHSSKNTLELTGVREPQFFALDHQGNAVISDAGNHSLCVFTMKGEQIKVIGGYGQEEGEFIHPQGIAVGNDGRIVSVCNRDKGQIQIF